MLDNFSQTGLGVIKETSNLNGESILFWLINKTHYKKLFVGIEGFPGHYNTLIRKTGISCKYAQFTQGWNYEELPLIENPPITGDDNVNYYSVDELLNLIKSEYKNECVILDSIFPLLTIYGELFTLKLINSILNEVSVLITKYPSEGETMQIFQDISSVHVEVLNVDSSEFSGQIIIRSRDDDEIMQEIGNYWYSESAFAINIIES